MKARLGPFIFSGLCLGLMLASRAGSAQEPTLPVPTVVIYPGDVVRDDMLTDEPRSQIPPQAEVVAQTREEVVGKVAKLTLLPWRPIPRAGVGAPRAVSNGAAVTLFYKAGGLTIVTEASALQDGSVGDMIRVRNIDSGLTVSGIVQSDGSVRVGG